MPLSNEVSEIEPEIQNAMMRLINLPGEEDGVFAPRTVELSAEAVSAFGPFWHSKSRTWMAGNGNGLPRVAPMS